MSTKQSECTIQLLSTRYGLWTKSLVGQGMYIRYGEMKRFEARGAVRGDLMSAQPRKNVYPTILAITL